MSRHCTVDELAAFVGGHLFGSQVRQVEAHLDACERCRQFMSALVKTNSDEGVTNAVKGRGLNATATGSAEAVG